MRLLITGANGQIGQEFYRHTCKTFNILGYRREQLDITHAVQVEDCLAAVKPSIVINTAAYTAVDKAESEPFKAFAANREGVKNLAQICQHHRIPLLHLSTDYVFDGNKTTPYDETDTTNPINVYGQSKWEGEQMVRQHCEQYIILRVSWVFGTHGNNFVKTMLRLGSEREELKIVVDQFGCPTPASAIAKTLLTIAEQITAGNKAWGTYHFCGTQATNWYEFAKTVFQLAKTKLPLRIQQVVPITTAEYPTPARRPQNSVLNTTKCKQVFQIVACDWQTALCNMLNAIS